jgi:diguanylate cyclase (GGDEF)-like protein
LLANRRAFLEGAERRLNARPSGAVAFLLFDLDNFKAINDGHGHAMGDRVLRLFAHTLSANLPRDSIVGRLGGEEFAAIVSGPDQQATIAAAEHVRESFGAAARIVDGVPIAATVSIGLAHADGRPADVEALCECADKALYQAKALGRNRVESAVDELVPLVPDASVEADVALAGLPIPSPKQARRATKTAAA